MNKVKYIIVTIVGIILALVLAFFTNNWIAVNNAKNAINNAKNSSGKIIAYNSEILLFTSGQVIENTNIEQKALGKNGKITRPASFIFSNGKTSENKKKVRAYLDFSEQRSRDFILLNKDMLKAMVEAGTIDLEIFSIPTGKAFSMFASEALAEAFVLEPSKSWDYFINLMKASAELESNTNADDMVNRLEELAKTSNITEIDVDSILNGSFSSWLLTVSEDPFLTTGILLPEVFVGNTALVDIINVNDSDQLRKAITGATE